MLQSGSDNIQNAFAIICDLILVILLLWETLLPSPRGGEGVRGGFGVHCFTHVTTVNVVPSKAAAIMSSSLSSSPSSPLLDGDVQPSQKAVWCPDRQIYVGGTVPHHSEDVQALLDESNSNGDGSIYIFGYGSLCWNPGMDGVLSHPNVTTQIGFAPGYQRIWGQKSTDHRGTPAFPGIVCTLLKTSEVESVIKQSTGGIGTTDDRRRMGRIRRTEGRLFRIPKELVEECLQELDFREKGGYSRDVIDVEVMNTEYDAMTTTRYQKALLYRGTTDNPAFWPRAVLDLPHAAAVISQAVGPSGPNNEYLTNLDEFLNLSLPLSGYSAGSGDDHNVDDDDTKPLACLMNECSNHSLYFLFGAGSNQHNQLLLRGRCRPNTVSRLKPKESFGDGVEVEVIEEEDVYEQTEILLTTRRQDGEDNADDKYKHNDPPIALFAGGGHSGLQTLSGKLYLFGWNDHGQCCSPSNRLRTDKKGQQVMSYDDMEPLPGIEIETASLGFAHTLVIERTTKRLLAFGDNRNGQVSGQKFDAKTADSSPFISTPTTPVFFIDKQVFKVSAGVYHSAAITADGTELIIFGEDEDYLSWKPFDDARLVDVACGRKHTVVIDNKNRIWTRGDNKYGQLGRPTSGKKDPLFELAGLFNHDDDISCRSAIAGVCCGWSHSVITVVDIDSREKTYYGCGRNDFGQLGTSDRMHIQTFKKVLNCKHVESLDCGSESTMVVVDGRIWGCGWNEHGNLATGTQNDALVLTPTTGASIVSPLDYASETNNTGLGFAVGGAHYVAAKTINIAK